MDTHRTGSEIVRLAGHIIALLLALLPVGQAARGEATREDQVKAAFAYNFLQFVEWPAASFDRADSPYVLAVLGDDPVGDALEQAVRGKAVNGRPIAFRRFKGIEDLGPCHLLFVPEKAEARAGRLAERLGASAVLTVGETEAFVRGGGTIRFYAENNRVRFEVNLDAAERAGLKISSKLLKLARIFGK